MSKNFLKHKTDVSPGLNNLFDHIIETSSEKTKSEKIFRKFKRKRKK